MTTCKSCGQNVEPVKDGVLLICPNCGHEIKPDGQMDELSGAFKGMFEKLSQPSKPSDLKSDAVEAPSPIVEAPAIPAVHEPEAVVVEQPVVVPEPIAKKVDYEKISDVVGVVEEAVVPLTGVRKLMAFFNPKPIVDATVVKQSALSETKPLVTMEVPKQVEVAMPSPNTAEVPKIVPPVPNLPTSNLHAPAMMSGSTVEESSDSSIGFAQPVADKTSAFLAREKSLYPQGEEPKMKDIKRPEDTSMTPGSIRVIKRASETPIVSEEGGTTDEEMIKMKKEMGLDVPPSETRTVESYATQEEELSKKAPRKIYIIVGAVVIILLLLLVFLGGDILAFIKLGINTVLGGRNE